MLLEVALGSLTCPQECSKTSRTPRKKLSSVKLQEGVVCKELLVPGSNRELALWLMQFVGFNAGCPSGLVGCLWCF